ncbi:MAG: dockerin type I domain-containing protein, partial [Anaerolineae bacterium]
MVAILLLGLAVSASGEVLRGRDTAAGDLACVPATCQDLAPACGLLDDGCGGTIQCDCPPGSFGSCVGDPSTRVTVGYFPVATPLGDCFFQPRKCVPGEAAWRLVRAVTMENDYIQITFADGGGGKVFDFQRKVDLERDAPDWSGQPGGEPPATTDPDDPRYPPDRAGRRWLLRGGDEGQGGCDSRPSNPGLKQDGTPCTLSDPEPGCVPRCEWSYIWGDENYDPKDRTAGIETGTPHFVHNVIGTGTQFSVALRDRDESKESCMLGSNWNPNSMGGCDGSPNGGCLITAAPDCAYNEATCWAGPPCNPTYDLDGDGRVDIIDITEIANVWRSTEPGDLAAYDLNQDDVIDVVDIALVAAHYCSPRVDPIGDNCGLDRDLWTDEQIISLTGEPFRLRDPTDPASGNAAEDHSAFPAPTVAEVGPRRVYLRTGMWRSFGRPTNFEAPTSVDDPIYTDPNAPGYIGKAYWKNRFRWRVHAGGPFCRDPQGKACTCDPDPNNCTCCPGSYTSADPKEWFNIDASQSSFDARLTECPDGQALCNGWPKEPGWERPFPDQGYNREDVWAEMYVCLQGPEAIFQLRLHHPGDPVRHGEGHPMPGHAIPQAHARGLFDWAVYGDRGKIHKERVPLQSLPVPKKLYDSASDNWIGVLNEEEVYGLFLYQRFNLGVNELGHSYGQIDRFLVRTSDDEGNKVKMTSHSYKFTAADSILDLEYRYILATPEYVRRHAACYNLGLPYPCGLEDADYVGDDGPALWTWQHNLTEERWSRVREQPPEPAECQAGEMGDGSTDCWFRLDFVDALIPVHAVRPAGT